MIAESKLDRIKMKHKMIDKKNGNTEAQLFQPIKML